MYTIMSFKYFATSSLLIIATAISVNIIQCQANDDTYHFDLENIPQFCNFFDTINITGGIINANKSITFDGIVFAQEDYAIFTYTYLTNHVKIQVPPHTRGCICKYKACVRLCCPPGHSFHDVVVGAQIRHHCEHNSYLKEINVKVQEDLETKEIDLLKHANIRLISEKPCKTSYFLDPDDPENDDHWEILSNGSILIGQEYPLVENHSGYCIAHAKSMSGEFILRAMVCSEVEKPKILGLVIYPAVMVVSVIFLSLTLFVYIWIEELRRTIHGKNLMCYLATLIIGYSFLAYIHVDDSHALRGPWKCLILAEIIHTSFICGFLWLSVISYDIWRTIGRSDNHRNQFVHYCIFVLGLTVLILVITNGLDHVDWFADKYKPGLGQTSCWLQDSKHSHFLYLYSIIIIIITINSVFFALTKMKIEWVKRISDRATNSEGSRKFARDDTDSDRFGLCLRLFIIMGIQWCIEIISWILDDENYFIYFLDVITMLQGPFIFFLFIKKRRVKKLIKRKLSTMSFLSSPPQRNSASVIGHSSSAMTTFTSTLKMDDVNH